MRTIGIDIGGANTKVASAEGNIVELHYVPLWKDTQLPSVLTDVSQRLGPDRVGVVMTGELADCFKDKAAGIRSIMETVDRAFDCDVRYVDNRGRVTDGTGDTTGLAAANWAASARLIGQEVGDCIFVDVGSTTSDIIPIKNGKHVAGTTDYSRLLNDELVYRGVLRTNIAAMLNRITISRGVCRTSSELFATTADAYLLLGDITPDLYTCETADGAEITEAASARRLARVVCADLSEISEDDVMQMARTIREIQISELCDAISHISKTHNLNTIVAAGLGEFLVSEAAERLDLDIFSIRNRWGEDISRVFPAYATARIIDMGL
ncbi:MAG: hydantoinase/oxoprolinase family protein [Euryarchaeota archaeon]|nr:hydantoinase/oxoprolinase family protein [Euryarchaeota archaeon]